MIRNQNEILHREDEELQSWVVIHSGFNTTSNPFHNLMEYNIKILISAVIMRIAIKL